MADATSWSAGACCGQAAAACMLPLPRPRAHHTRQPPACHPERTARLCFIYSSVGPTLYTASQQRRLQPRCIPRRRSTTAACADARHLRPHVRFDARPNADASKTNLRCSWPPRLSPAPQLPPQAARAAASGHGAAARLPAAPASVTAAALHVTCTCSSAGTCICRLLAPCYMYMHLGAGASRCQQVPQPNRGSL